MAAAAPEHGRTHPPPHGSTRAHARGHGPAPGHTKPGERGPAWQEGAEHGNGAASACALPLASRPSHSATQGGAARLEAGRSLTRGAPPTRGHARHVADPNGPSWCYGEHVVPIFIGRGAPLYKLRHARSGSPGLARGVPAYARRQIRINDQFRVCFVWTAEGPEHVEIVDCH